MAFYVSKRKMEVGREHPKDFDFPRMTEDEGGDGLVRIKGDWNNGGEAVELLQELSSAVGLTFPHLLSSVPVTSPLLRRGEGGCTQ